MGAGVDCCMAMSMSAVEMSSTFSRSVVGAELIVGDELGAGLGIMVPPIPEAEDVIPEFIIGPL